MGDARSLQTVSPRLKRLVFARAHGRCEVPGCANTRWLDIHHLTRRVDGGRNDEETCFLACSTHHRLLHQGRLIVEGTRSTGLVFKHADGTLYGAAPTPHEGEAAREAHQALRALGLEAAVARILIAGALRELGGASSAVELVRAAMRIHGRGIAAKHAPVDAAHEGPPHVEGIYARALRALGSTALLTRDRANKAA